MRHALCNHTVSQSIQNLCDVACQGFSYRSVFNSGIFQAVPEHTHVVTAVVQPISGVFPVQQFMHNESQIAHEHLLVDHRIISDI